MFELLLYHNLTYIHSIDFLKQIIEILLDYKDNIEKCSENEQEELCSSSEFWKGEQGHVYAMKKPHLSFEKSWETCVGSR